MIKYILPLLALLLSACGQDNTPAPKLMETQREVLDQAKSLDAQLQQQTEEQRKALDQQSQ